MASVITLQNRGRKKGGEARSRVLGSCTKRLALAELEAMREERRRALAAATARWEAERCPQPA